MRSGEMGRWREGRCKLGTVGTRSLAPAQYIGRGVDFSFSFMSTESREAALDYGYTRRTHDSPKFMDVELRVLPS